MMKIKIITLLLSLLVVDCYSQGDCPPTPVCANTTGLTTIGLSSELNATNQGCLFGEAPRTSWLSICFTSNGVFRFSLTPGGGVNNDMDWAMWGPNSTCPPTTTPIRCSYAAVPLGGPKVTGINSTNNSPQTDLSEGATGNQWVQDLNVLSGQCYIICISNYAGGNNNWSLNFTGTTATMLCSALPIELVSFEAFNRGSYNYVTWVCATETNNDYFKLERSTDGIVWNQIDIVDGAGTSNVGTFYSYNDYSYVKNEYNYYRLSQVDFNGQSETFNIIVVNNINLNDKRIVKITNLMGQDVDDETEGVLIYYYSDGTHQKVCKIKN